MLNSSFKMTVLIFRTLSHRKPVDFVINRVWNGLANLVSSPLLGWCLRLRPALSLAPWLAHADRRCVAGLHFGRGLMADFRLRLLTVNLFLCAIRHRPAQIFPPHACGRYLHPQFQYLTALCHAVDCNNTKHVYELQIDVTFLHFSWI